METFNWESFTKKIAVKSSITKLYNAWTVPNELKKWFLSKALFYKPNGETVIPSQNVQQNYTYEWSWFLYDVIEKGEIKQANGRDFLQFTFAGNCLVDIKLTQVNEVVIVELTQSNIPTDNQSKRGIRLGCDSGWSFFLVNLKSVYEGGIDLRNKDAKLKGMLNS